MYRLSIWLRLFESVSIATWKKIENENLTCNSLQAEQWNHAPTRETQNVQKQKTLFFLARPAVAGGSSSSLLAS